MTLPFIMPPQVWPFALMAAGMLLWAYTRRTDHFLKRLFWYMAVSQAEAYRFLLGRHDRFNPKRATIAARVMFWLLMALLLSSATVSLAVWVGAVHNPASPAPSALPAFDAGKYEIVTDGQTIDAHPKAGPSTQGQ